MRTLKLEVEGFTAFRDRTVVDFSGLDLFAITGPTGAGKSSLIDAICYALYGRVPRVNAEMASCISQGLDRLQVVLEFQAGDNRYRVFRETRRKGAPNVRLEYWLDDRWEPHSQGAREVSDRIEHIIGLTYDGFTRSVLLPQGQFEEFLAGSPDKRRDVLRSLLRLEVYEKMRERAGRISGDYRAEIAAKEATLRDQYGGATLDALQARREELGEQKGRAMELAGEVGCLESLALAVGRLDAALTEVERRTGEERSVAADLDSARTALSGGQEAIEEASQDLAVVRERLEKNGYDDRFFAALTRGATLAFELEREHQKLAAAREAVEAGKRGVKAGEGAIKSGADVLCAATAGREAAELAYEEARRHDLAAALQSGLRAGDTCPVCGGKVGEIAPAAAPDLEKARVLSDHARSAETSAREAQSRAATAMEVARARLEVAESQVAELGAGSVRRAAELAEEIPGIADRSFATLKVALDVQKSARDERERLSAEVRDLQERLSRLEQQLSDARNNLAVLEERAEKAQSGLRAAQSALDENRAAVDSALQGGRWPDLLDALTSGRPLAGAVEVRRGAARAAHEAALKAAGNLEGLIERLERDIDAAARLREDVKRLQAENDVAADLAQMLRADRFQAFVQAEALRLLAADGSEKLRRLSDRRYTLGVSPNAQDFEVIDEWNAAERRSVRTLSGGETFLASLALALALAETLPGLAAGQRIALDSVFLDEGFGTLDPESLRLAADALDSLRTEGRMVCVVTHLRDLAERLPARIEVTKSETGSRAVIA